ncbi:MAG: dihydropteroate synthase [Rhodospirillales bacterium]|nr:dihydropteroate synthase [Rhodospirillales bacterium]
MRQRILFLTGRLAEPRLRQVLAAMEEDDLDWEVRDIGIQVAALMTPDLIRRRVPRESVAADRVLVPGYCRGDLEALSAEFGIPVERGPEDLHDIPAHFGRTRLGIDLSRHAVRIFAEIVDAPMMTIEAILAQARAFAADGADVIDVGCLPGTRFPHLEEAVAALHEAGFVVSVDSADDEELRRAGRAGADFVFSLSETNLRLADEMAATPVVVPANAGDLDSLVRAAETLERAGRPFIADCVLDPIPFGFAASVARYVELRRRLPEARILMGIGNLTELTEADTTGINAALFGLIAELGITDVLAVEKSLHCRSAIREADRARRIMYAAKTLGRLPVGIDPGLAALRDRKPYSTSPEEIAATAGEIRDRNFRIEVAADGIHVYNRDGHYVARDAFELYPRLEVADDGAHAFYLGAELMKAQTAFELGKRYVQDEPLDWGVAVPRAAPDLLARPAPGPTLQERHDKGRGRHGRAGRSE